MPFPERSDAEWPPKALGDVRRDLAVAAAWYSGDPDRLQDVYGEQVSRSTGSTNVRGQSFWGRRDRDKSTNRQRLHVPIAGDMAQVSADLLFGEDINLVPPEDAGETAAAEVEELALDVDLNAVLVEGAEVGAGIGGVFLVPSWDDEGPTLNVVQPDAALPTWRGRRLVEVLFWSRVKGPSDKFVYRHLELWRSGEVENRLYVGDDKHIGVQAPLVAVESTAKLSEVAAMPGVLEDRMAIEWVPNMLPNRKHRNTQWGRADATGSETLMDALDETFTSWMRDVRLGQARILVPTEFMQRRTTTQAGNRGGGRVFDVDTEVFHQLDMDPETTEKAGITDIQFEIRHEEHARTALELMERIVTNGGWSPESFGLHTEGGRADSGKALKIREGRTFRTLGKKQRYWSPAVSRVVEALLAIKASVFGDGSGEVFRPRVEFPDLVSADMTDVATSIDMFHRANAMSVETRVRLAQPDLDQAGVEAEVKRILDETGALVPEPTGGAPDGGEFG